MLPCQRALGCWGALPEVYPPADCPVMLNMHRRWEHLHADVEQVAAAEGLPAVEAPGHHEGQAVGGDGHRWAAPHCAHRRPRLHISAHAPVSACLAAGGKGVPVLGASQLPGAHLLLTRACDGLECPLQKQGDCTQAADTMAWPTCETSCHSLVTSCSQAAVEGAGALCATQGRMSTC